MIYTFQKRKYFNFYFQDSTDCIIVFLDSTGYTVSQYPISSLQLLLLLLVNSNISYSDHMLLKDRINHSILLAAQMERYSWATNTLGKSII